MDNEASEKVTTISISKRMVNLAQQLDECISSLRVIANNIFGEENEAEKDFPSQSEPSTLLQALEILENRTNQLRQQVIRF